MKSVVLVSLDYNLCKRISKMLSEKLNFEYLDFEKLLNDKISENISNKKFSIDDYDFKINEVINSLLKQKNSVVAMEADIFLKDNNYDRFNEFNTIFLDNGKMVCNIKNKKERAKCNDLALVHNNLSRYLKTIDNFSIDTVGKTDEIIVSEILKGLNNNE